MQGSRALGWEDVGRAAALSAAAGWNQTAADWGVFVARGAVRGVDDGAPGALAATAAVLPYARASGWISMVLVRPDRRREGLATGLLGWAVAALRAGGVRAILLDATPAGRAVYGRLGFVDAWGLRRWRLPAALPPVPGVAVRALRDADWPAVLGWDAEVFGADRGWLLGGLAARLPAAALVVDGPDGLRGALFGREGRVTPQLGPLLACDAAAARALLAAGVAAAPGAVLDLRDGAFGLDAWLPAQGAVVERGFTRMALGAPPPGEAATLVAVAGPEFG